MSYSKNTSSKKTGKSSISNNNSDNDVDYKNSSAIDSRSKSTSNKASEKGSK
jgi:hypothetical protein